MYSIKDKLVAHARHLSNRARSRMTGTQIDSTVHLRGRSMIQDGVTIGAFSFINRGVEIERGATIGRGVAVGPGVRIYTYDHEIGPASQRAAALRHRPVTVGDGCWLGVYAVVLPGVSIAPGCVIAAGAVVTKDTAPNGLYAGVPARRVRDLDQ